MGVDPPASQISPLSLRFSVRRRRRRHRHERVYENKSRRAPTITRGRFRRVLICLGARESPERAGARRRAREKPVFPRIRAQNLCSRTMETPGQRAPRATTSLSSGVVNPSGWKPRDFPPAGNGGNADARSPRPVFSRPNSRIPFHQPGLTIR